MSTPSKVLGLPIIGTLITKEVKIDIEDTKTGEKTQEIMQSESYEVIAEYDTFFVVNKWYKEHSNKPQLIPRDFVEVYLKTK